MRGLVLIAAIVSIVVIPPAHAQRGGGRGFTGGAVHFVGGMRSAPSHPVFAGAPHFQSSGSHHSGGYYGCYGCSSHQHHNTYYHWWPRVYGYPFYGYGLGYSYYSPLLWDQSSSYSQDERYESERALTRQIDELNQEVERLREEQERRPYRALPSGPPENPPPPEASRTSAESRKDLPTILVFRDQHIQEVQNYAIIGKDLVVVAEQRSTKIPLAKLDLAATAKLNDERGVDFQVPQ